MNKLNTFLEALKRFDKATVLCVGEVVLDHFIYSDTRRLSSEAPIPVMLFERDTNMLGGSGNVVANIKSLGAKPVLVSVLGSNPQDEAIKNKLKEVGVVDATIVEKGRQTTVKSRYMCQGQQVFRYDIENPVKIKAETENRLLDTVKKHMKKAGVVILSDYGQGILTDRVIAVTIRVAKKYGVPVVVDPRRDDFSIYRGATIVKPNLKELEKASGQMITKDGEMYKAAIKVMKESAIENILVTRDKDGMSLISGKESLCNIKSKVKEVYDVSGAGDTVIAALSIGIANREDMYVSAFIANLAAGVAVGKLGTATVKVDEIKMALEESVYKDKFILLNTSLKIIDRKEAAKKIEYLKLKNITVGFTNGCFDLMHQGHLSSLRQARMKCDFLVVGVNSDASATKVKGEEPLRPQDTRAELLAAMEFVDMVVIFNEESVQKTIEAVKPSIIFKGADYKNKEIPGKEFVESYGGKCILLDLDKNFEVTSTIKKKIIK